MNEYIVEVTVRYRVKAYSQSHAEEVVVHELEYNESVSSYDLGETV